MHNYDHPNNCQTQKYNTLIIKQQDAVVTCLTQSIHSAMLKLYSLASYCVVLSFPEFLGYLKIANVS